MIKKASMFLATFALLGIFVTSASAQLTGGRVTGSVVDQNAAAVSGATVNLRNKATGQTLTTQTESGAFNFPNAIPGDYEITIEQLKNQK